MLSQRLHDRTHRPTSVTGPVTLSAVSVARPTPSRLGSPRQGRPTLTRPVRLAVLSRRDASCRLVHRRSSDRGHSRSDPRPPGESQGRKAGVARLVRGRRAVAPSSASQAPPSIAANRCFNTLASSLPRAASRQRAANPSSLPDPPPLYDIRPRPTYDRSKNERDDDRVIRIADDGYRARNEADRHREVGEEQPRPNADTSRKRRIGRRSVE
jgi:hypothetical protein